MEQRQHAARRAREVIILDADDTLWSTAPLFEGARQACQTMIAAIGLDPAEWRELQVAEDMRLIDTLHFGRAQFPTACATAYRTLAVSAGRIPDEAVAAALYALADGTFSAPAALVPGVERVLEQLGRTHRLVLLTKGDPAVQAQRILSSGLGHYFEKVVIVPEKSAATFAGICLGLGVPPTSAWSVGNSLKSDVNTALRAGLRGVWLNADFGVWAYETTDVREPGVLLEATSLRAVPTAIARQELAERRAARGREDLGSAEVA